MQEVPWTWSTRSTARYFAERTGMNYAYLSANGNRWTILFAEGEAILSKYPLKDVEFLELKPRAGFFEHRVALKVTAAAPWGDIQLVSTHLTDGDTDVNQSQLHNLYQFVSGIGGGNVIVAGDFNARESSYQIQFLINKWIDTYRLANPVDQGCTCCVDHLSGSEMKKDLDKRIDYIFLVQDQHDHAPTVIGSQRIFTHPFEFDHQQLWASDHLGVMTTFSVFPKD